jgi:hypothetical protein
MPESRLVENALRMSLRMSCRVISAGRGALSSPTHQRWEDSARIALITWQDKREALCHVISDVISAM